MSDERDSLFKVFKRDGVFDGIRRSSGRLAVVGARTEARGAIVASGGLLMYSYLFI